MSTDTRHLVTTQWLEDHLHDAELRILDCTVFLEPAGDGVRPVSGRKAWQEEHIPGAGFADLLADLSDRNTPLPLMMPPAAQFAEAMSRYGVGEGTRVVLYDALSGTWAARLWWMLRAFGFDDAAVLDGGLRKWKAEGRALSNEPPAYPPGRFVQRPRKGFIASKQDVIAAMNDPGVRLVNALSADQHSGKVTRVGRPGHIPGSVNVPAESLIDPKTNAHLPAAELRKRFEAAGALDRPRVITYCGGGIAACGDAFALALLGVNDVAVYDGSLLEWASDPSLPLSTEG